MSDKIQILIDGILNPATKKALQAELTQLSKQASAAVSQAKKSTARSDDRDSELKIKLWKAQEAAIERVRKAEEAQDKAIQSALKEQEAALNETIKIRQKLSAEENKQTTQSVKNSERIIEAIRKQSDAQDKLADQARKYSINQSQLISGQKGSLRNRLEGMVVGKGSLLSGSSTLTGTYKNLQTDIEKFGQAGSKTYKQLNNDLGKFNNSLRLQAANFKNNNHDGYNMIEMLGVAARKYAIWLATTTLTMQTFRAIQNGVAYVTELDNALNEIRIVTGQSQEQVEALAVSYGKLAESMSVTTMEIAKQAAELYRQGLADQDVEERMKGIITYAKISGLSVDESGKIITATMNATGESIDKVINTFAILGDMTASGADEIGEAMQSVASNAQVAGLSLEKTASYIATISSITRQSASTIGRSISSVLSRYISIKEKGFSEEDATNLNQVTKALKSIGINAIDSEGQLRNFGDVLDELGPKFNTLSTNQRNYIATTLFGTYQMNRGITLLSNYTKAQDNYNLQLNSAGVAQQKYNIYQESTQAHLDKLTASWQNLASKLIDSDMIKTIVDIGAAFADAIPFVLGLTAAIAGFYLAIKIGVASTAIQTWLGSLITGLGATTAAATGATLAFGALAGVGIGAVIIGAGLLIKALSEQYQKMQEIKTATDNLTDAYKQLENTPSKEAMANVENAFAVRLALIDAEIAKLKELKEAWYATDESGTTINLIANISEWFKQFNPDTLPKLEKERANLIIENSQKIQMSIAKEQAIFSSTLPQAIEQGNNQIIASELELTKSTESVTDAFKGFLDTIDSSKSSLSSLADAYANLQDGQKMSKSEYMDLVAKHPAVAKVYSNETELIADKGAKLKTVFEIEKNTSILSAEITIKTVEQKIKAFEDLRFATLNVAQGFVGMSDAMLQATRQSIGGADYSKMLGDLRQARTLLQNLQSIDITSAVSSIPSKKGKTAEEIRKENIAAVTDAQKAITEVIKTEVEKRKDEINSAYEDEIEAIDKVMEANKKRWAEEDFNKSVTEQEDALKKLNAEKSKYMAAALSGDLVAQAKVKEIDEEIAENKKKLDETQTDRSRDLQTEALETMKSVAEEQKDAQLESLNTIYDETQVTSNAIQALFATNLAGFETLLSSYLSKLGLAEGEIKRVVGSVAGSFSSAQAGVGIAKGSGVSAGEFGSFAEGGKSPMQVAMEASGKYSAAVIKADLAKLLALQASWATATDKAAVNRKANEIRAKYGISDPQGYRYQAWSYVGSFASGGVNDSSGWARLHGTAARPEYILNYDQAKEAVMGNYSNTPLRNLSNTTNNNGDVSLIVNFNGPVDKAAVPSIRESFASEVKKLLVKGGQSRPLMA